MRRPWDSEKAMQRLREKNAGRHRLRILKTVIERDGPECFWCDKVTLITARKHLHLKSRPGRNDGEMRRYASTLEHIIPMADGGEDTAENGLCACYACNRRRDRIEASVYLFSLIVEGKGKWRIESNVAYRSAADLPAAPNSANGYAATTGA